MCMLQIHVHCYDKFSEVSPDEVENAEFAVEDVISPTCLTFLVGGDGAGQ